MYVYIHTYGKGLYYLVYAEYSHYLMYTCVCVKGTIAIVSRRNVYAATPINMYVTATCTPHVHCTYMYFYIACDCGCVNCKVTILGMRPCVYYWKSISFESIFQWLCSPQSHSASQVTVCFFQFIPVYSVSHLPKIT